MAAVILLTGLKFKKSCDFYNTTSLKTAFTAVFYNTSDHLFLVLLTHERVVVLEKFGRKKIFGEIAI